MHTRDADAIPLKKLKEREREKLQSAQVTIIVVSSKTVFLIVVLILVSITDITNAQQSDDVVLTSTLADYTASPGEEIVFMCTTLSSNILQWSSSEYIGRNSHIQVYNGTLGTDVRRGSAHATLVRAALENGVLVLVSELHIRVSTLYPTATIQCDNNGHGSHRIITFALQNVTLTSTLTEDLVAYDEQEIIFTCTTLFSNILQWNSSKYIGRNSHIQVYNGTLGTDVRRGSAHATLVRAALENGVLVLVSELRIRASTLHPTATIECNNNGHGSSQTIIFNSINRPTPRLNSSLSEGMFVCPGERIQFECATTDSQTLVWMSNVYFGSDAALHFSCDSPLNVAQNISEFYYAMLTNRSIETGKINLTSTLSITVLESIKNISHSIICLDNVGTRTTISFHLAETCEEPTTTSMSTKSNVESESNDNSQSNLPIVAAVVVILVVAAAIIAVIITLWIFKRKGRRSNKVSSCIQFGNQTKNTSQYGARDTLHKQEEAPPISPSNSTISSDSDDKSVPDSGSTSSSVVDDSVESLQDLISMTKLGDGTVNCEEICIV